MPRRRTIMGQQYSLDRRMQQADEYPYRVTKHLSLNPQNTFSTARKKRYGWTW